MTCAEGGITLDYSCYNEQLDNFTETAAGSTTESDLEAVTGITTVDAFTKNVPLKWRCLRGWLGSFSLISQEAAVVKLVNVPNNTWNFESLTHSGISMQGSTIVGATIAHSNGTGTPTVGTNAAAISVSFSVTYTFNCNCSGAAVLFSWVTPQTKNYTAGAVWSINAIGL